MQKTLHSLGSCVDNFSLIQISSILSVNFTGPEAWMPESVYMGQLHHSKACWELWFFDDQPHSDNNEQWQRALCICMVAVLQSSQPAEELKKENVCYKTNLDLCRIPGHATQAEFVRYTWLSAYVPDKSALALARYSAQLVICIT